MTKITSVETYVAGSICLVQVRTDDGLVGIGQTAPSQPQITADVLHRLIAPHVLGASPWDLPSLVDSTVRSEYKYLGSFLFRALSGVDTALWDLQGKLVGEPVYRLLGGAVRERVPVYASSMSRDTDPAYEVARIDDLVQRHGLRAAKIKIGIRNGRDKELWSGRTAKLVPMMREHFGEDFGLNTDANGAYSPSGAIAVGRHLESYAVYHLEEPTPCWELDNIGYVADHLDLPIGAGEQEFSLEMVRRMISDRLVDVIQPDVCYIGGLTRARQVAQMADDAGIPCTPHSSGHSLIKVFTAHLVLASAACTQHQEWSVEDPGIEFYGPVPTVEDGHIALDEAPGWGVEVLPGFLELASRDVTELA